MNRERRSVPTLLRGALVRLALVASSILVFVGLAEVLLRTVPVLVPAGTYHGSGSYDPELGFLLPDSTVLYNKVRTTRRTPNRDGFMDVDHAVEKPPGVLRVGFFGDSYVAAVQVPLEQVFFRRLPSRLGGRPIEWLGFGVPGLGTLHSLLLYRKLGRRYDVDVVVHLFVHNDPGDNSFAIQQAQRAADTRPAAVLAPGPAGFEVRRGPSPDERPWTVRLAQRAKSRSLLARVLYNRLRLLRRQARDRPPTAGGADSGRLPWAGDPPSAWPPDLLAEARLLTRRILAQMSREVGADGRSFLVLYVPLGTEELDGSLPVADRWLPWLAATCDELDIPLIDPSAALRARQEAGDPVYDDHWSPAGHEVIAAALAAALPEFLDGAGSTRSPLPTTEEPATAAEPGPPGTESPR